MIEAYWNEVFGHFKQASGKFEIPGFPEGLMSAHFGVTNIIGQTDKEIKQSFKLCLFESLVSGSGDVLVEPLASAVHSAEFWNYQLQHNNETMVFMKKLLPFLLSLNHSHYHLFVRNEHGICASTIIGMAESGTFLFNLSVSPEDRKSGLAKTLINFARWKFSHQGLFYWTVHPWFTNDGKVLAYHLVN